MTVGSAMSSAAMRLFGRRPNTFFGATGTFEQELCDLVNDVAHDIAERQDWQALTRVYRLSSDGVSTEYPFPSDYSRQLVDSALQDPENFAFGYTQITDINDFLHREMRGFMPYPGGWIMYDNKFHFVPPPRTGVAAVFPYITKNYARSVDGASKSAFTTDSDEFLLEERLLTLGLVWRWRENKKLDYTGDMERFEEALAEVGTKDRGSRIIRSRTRLGGNFVTALPWSLPTV